MTEPTRKALHAVGVFVGRSVAFILVMFVVGAAYGACRLGALLVLRLAP